jgi:hypothetical protein
LRNIRSTSSRIYVDAYKATLLAYQRTKGFPKHLRPSLARHIEENALSCLLAVHKAGLDVKARPALLSEASLCVDHLRVLFQLSKDLGVLSFGAFAELSELNESVSKSVGALRKYLSANAH